MAAHRRHPVFSHFSSHEFHTMAILNVPGTYATIRAALIAAANGDAISIAAGSYSINATGYNNSLAYSAAANSSTGFINGVTSLIYNASSVYHPTITGNARLFQKNVDGKAPVSVTYSDLDFFYSGGSGYILQTGDFGVSEANTLTKSITINHVSFRDTHTGNAGASGNYAAVLGIRNFQLTNSSVSLTNQATFHAAAGIGGSSFLMLNGGQGTGGALVIVNNRFDEAGYRNALSIFDSVNVTIAGNIFSRSRNRNVRSGGEKLKDTTGTVSGNYFFDGSYLAVEKIASGTVNVTGNTFAQFASSSPNPISGGGAVGIVLQGAMAASALGTVSGNTFDYVAPFANATPNVITINSALGASTNIYVDPITYAKKTFNSYYVGTIGGDILAGTTSPEYFIGGYGNDTIATAGGVDYILFNTPLDPVDPGRNVDTITGFNTSSRIILDRMIFTGISAGYSFLPGSIGAVNNSTQVENNTTGVASSPSTRIVYNTNTGSLFYDQDGSGGVYAPIEFAKLYSSGTTPYNSTGMVGFNGTNLSSVNIGII